MRVAADTMVSVNNRMLTILLFDGLDFYSGYSFPNVKPAGGSCNI